MDPDQELALLGSVLADPDSDAPRLVMAGWYDDHDCPRGEFIRVHCALARLPADDPNIPALTQRYKEGVGDGAHRTPV